MSYRKRPPEPERDPCACEHRCEVCKSKCSGGHANYPDSHWCMTCFREVFDDQAP